MYILVPLWVGITNIVPIILLACLVQFRVQLQYCHVSTPPPVLTDLCGFNCFSNTKEKNSVIFSMKQDSYHVVPNIYSIVKSCLFSTQRQTSFFYFKSLKLKMPCIYWTWIENVVTQNYDLIFVYLFICWTCNANTETYL